MTSTPRPDKLRDLFRRHYALPAEHGSWIWWLGPMAIGVAAAQDPGPSVALLFITALAAFLLRQPAAILVKTFSGRRPRHDRFPALFWLIFYGAITIAFVALLLKAGHERVVLLAIPGLPVFIWHLWLVSRRAERGQMGVELVGAGVLSLTAPAAYWVSGGSDDQLAWLLWILTWLQAAASIVHVFLRLEQRSLQESPIMIARIKMGSRTLLYHGFNFTLSLFLMWADLIPRLVSVSYALMFVDALDGVVHPAMGVQPTRIGMRQLVVSIFFVLLMVLAYAWIG